MRLISYNWHEGTRRGQSDIHADVLDRLAEPGAMPPFGNLYDMDVLVDQVLAEDEEIAFNAGTHTELMRMSWLDYEELVKPTLGTFAFKLTPEMGGVDTG